MQLSILFRSLILILALICVSAFLSDFPTRVAFICTFLVLQPFFFTVCALRIVNQQCALWKNKEKKWTQQPTKAKQHITLGRSIQNKLHEKYYEVSNIYFIFDDNVFSFFDMAEEGKENTTELQLKKQRHDACKIWMRMAHLIRSMATTLGIISQHISKSFVLVIFAVAAFFSASDRLKILLLLTILNASHGKI